LIGGPPKIRIEPKIINLKEGQRMIVQYSVSVSLNKINKIIVLIFGFI
jgi:hypothetical protein